MEYEKQRKQIVESLEKIGYIKTISVKNAMLKIKREDFVSLEYKENAYIDTPLPIPGDQTISALHMHAISLEALELKPGEKFLEIGSGSGIILAYAKEIVGEKGKVFGIELVKETYEFGKENLKRAGYWNKVKLIHGDGSLGLPKEAPFDKILISAASPKIPPPLIKQLNLGGRIIAIIGTHHGDQNLVYLEKTKEGKLKSKTLLPVVFVPLKGKYGFK
jgi:protein-L-isoaspartate(D-aspartate) O-methyltransferase